MDTNILLIILSGLVIFSYIFEIIAKKTHIPSVLLLLTTGILLKVILDSFDVSEDGMMNLLPLLGTLGLILIVLEGALDLQYEKSKRKIIAKALLSALVIMALTIGGISFLFYIISNMAYETCILNAIPFSVISSAIAIPSASVLEENKKEFIVYESTFSDILGIIFFNFFLYNNAFNISTFTIAGQQIILTIFVSVILCFVLIYLLNIIAHKIKFFLILSVLILAYSLSKSFHLSALIIVFSFGLLLGNIKLVKPLFFKKLMTSESLRNDIAQLTNLTAETSFLARTFFFLVFGYIINLQSLYNPSAIFYGLMILGIIYMLRFIWLKLIKSGTIIPELFISPRGLISILLFFNIPADKMIFSLEDGLLFFILLTSSIIMAIGIIYSKRIT
jgi:NhaP-type Na+/H+ or K+/H+ antiporter